MPPAAAAPVTFRRFRDGDEAAVNHGFERAFATRRPLAEWRWKFPPDPRGRPIVIAVDERGNVLAHFGGIRERLQVDGREVPAAQNVDVYAVPEARRGVLGSSVYAETASAFWREYLTPDELALSYGFPGPRNAAILTRHLECVPIWQGTLWERAAGRRPGWWTGHEVRIGGDPAAADALWRRAAPRYPVAVRRDGARLARRFSGRPGVDYRQLTAWRRGVPHALLVLRLDAATARWADLVWDGEDPRAVAAVDRAAARLADAAGVEHHEAWLAGDEAGAEALRARGWRCRPDPSGVCMVARLGADAPPAERLAGRWYVTMGDADLV